VTLQVLFF